jgi:hypothetical protein
MASGTQLWLGAGVNCQLPACCFGSPLIKRVPGQIPLLFMKQLGGLFHATRQRSSIGSVGSRQFMWYYCL